MYILPIIFKQNKIVDIAQLVIRTTKQKTLCFYGDMGSGKTTLIKALVKGLGGGDTASSPSFGLVNEYYNKKGELLGYHFDFYRITDETEALDLGLEDYLNRDVWVFIEWPEKIASLLTEDCTKLYLEIIDQDTRKLVF
jgi:tRNA threonylcarbamoyladenosine biosynthesis protein TsaE